MPLSSSATQVAHAAPELGPRRKGRSVSSIDVRRRDPSRGTGGSFMDEDIGAIEAAVQTYLDGLYEGDADKLSSVFHPTSSLTYEDGGTLTPMARDDWLKVVRERASAKTRGLARHDHILQIDLATPTMALVKLKCALPPLFFTDYLSFLKVEGRWQVAQKVFARERRPSADGQAPATSVGTTAKA
jgi:Putative lumazine-binding